MHILDQRRYKEIILAVFLVTLSLLSVEIALTRLFSLVLYYHYVFIVVSSAILGLGIAGFYMYRKRSWLLGGELRAKLSGFLLLYAVSLPIVLLFILSPFLNNSLIVYITVSAVPFFCAGLFLSAIYYGYSSSTNIIYFFDLVGASLGCLSVVFIMKLLGAVNVILFYSSVVALSAFIMALFADKKTIRYLSLTVFVLSAVILLMNRKYQYDTFLLNKADIDKPMFYSLKSGTSKITDTRWSVYARTDLVEDKDYPNVKWIYTDATNSTIMLRFDGDLKKKEKLKDFIGYFPFHFSKDDDVLLIGSGGGIDVILALVGKAKKITAVEINPAIVDIVKDNSLFNGGIYNNYNGVDVVVDEGRSFIKRSRKSYDIIYLSLVLTATPQSISYAMVENYLYTKDAFREYLKHLNPEGRLVIIEQSYERMIKLFSSGLGVLVDNKLGVPDAMNHMALINVPENTSDPTGYRNAFILKKGEFNNNESEQMYNLCQKRKYNTVHMPGYEQGIFSDLKNGSVSYDEFIYKAPYNIMPCSDDSPFFFNLTKGIKGTVKIMSMPIVVFSVGLVLIIWTLLKRKHYQTKIIKRVYRFMLYISGLGIGFMLVEIPLIQKFQLFLGSPTLTLSIILFSLLFSGGIGSFTSKHLTEKYGFQIISYVSIGITLIIIMFMLTTEFILNALLHYTITIRVIITVVLLSPLGFLMGMPFPNILKELGRLSPDDVPWMWGLNGVTSVLGSISAVVISLYFGFTAVLFSAAVCYGFIGFSIYMVDKD